MAAVERQQQSQKTRRSGTAGERVYRTVRARIIGGQIAPGRAVTLRGLAADLDVSPMPVREAIRRLVAEGALEVSATRRLAVPQMTQAKFEELVLARERLEPAAARLALPHIDRKLAAKLRETDDELNDHLHNGNVEGYAAANFAFHFMIYRASGSQVLVPLIESLWLRFGPFMRIVYGRVGTNWVVDHHDEALRAIERGSADDLAQAIRADILEGMQHIGDGMFAEEDAASDDGA